MGLVALSPLLSSPEEGDGNEDGVGVSMEAWIFFEGLVKKVCEGGGEEELPTILEAVDEVKGLG